jgi:hypothetical protein
LNIEYLSQLNASYYTMNWTRCTISLLQSLER